MPENTMKVYQKWEDMAESLYVALKSYPKSERFTLAAITSKTLWKIGTRISEANAVGDRTHKLKAVKSADLALIKLKILVRMGMRLKYMSMKQYSDMADRTTEIGKMIGGWLKSI